MVKIRNGVNTKNIGRINPKGAGYLNLNNYNIRRNNNDRIDLRNSGNRPERYIVFKKIYTLIHTETLMNKKN